MEQNLLTMEEVKRYFQVKDNRTIHKFIKEGLPVIKIGSKDFRFDKKDVLEFAEIKKQEAQFEIIKEIPIRKKVKHKTIDWQKRRINLELNKVV